MLHDAMRRFALALSMLATLAVSAPVYAGSAEALWAYETTGGYLDSSPAIADLDGDGSPDVCIASLIGPVFALDAFGREIWAIDLKERITIAPTAVDVSGDGAPELLVLAQTGRLYCLEGRSGDVVWIYDIPSATRVDSVADPMSEYSGAAPIKHGGTAIIAVDMDGDGALEIVTNTVTGTVVCLNASGDLLWSYDAGESLPSAPAVGDLDGDGVAEVVVGSFEHPVIALSADGAELWKHGRDLELAGVGRNADVTSLVIVDLDGDGSGEIVTYDQSTMIALNGDGQPRWATVAARRKVDASLTVVDADRDGSPEIYAVDLTGDVVRVNADGSLIWTTNIGQRCRRSFSAADVDGDGDIEIVVGAYTGKIHVLTPGGVIEDELAIGSGTNATSTLADLLGDGSVCVVTPEITGNLSVYRWAAGAATPTILLPGYRGGNARTASEFASSVERTRLFDKLSTGSAYGRSPAFVAEIANPSRDRLTVELTVADDHGVVAEERRTVRGRSGRARASYDGSRLVGNAVYTCTVRGADGIVETHTFSYAVVPYAAALTALQEQSERIAALLPNVPDGSGVVERHAHLQMSLSAPAAKIAALDGLTALQLRALRDELAGLSDGFDAVETLVGAAAEAGTVLRVSAANPWAPFGGVRELSENRMGTDSLSVEGFQGEVESAALSVWNFSGTAKTLRVTMGALTHGDTSVSDAVTLREVVSVATQMADMSADALPRLNESRTVVVPAWSARQLWLEVNTTNLSAGSWTGEVRLKNMGVDAAEVSAPLTATVWSIPQSREHAFKLCGWSNTSPDGVLRDMFDHGMNVFTDAHAVLFEYDAEGSIVSADYSELDAYMATHAPEGTALFHSLVRLSGPAEADSPVWKKAYAAAVRRFSAHIIEIGFGYDDYAYYPVDEPGIEEGRNVARFVKLASIAHEADPDLRIYTNPAGPTKQWLTDMMPYADIYAPMHVSSWQNDPDMAERMAEMHADAEEMWTYTCAHNAKHQSPLGYYRAQMWMCFNHRHVGGGFYTYSRGAEGFWHQVGGEYSLVYQGDAGPVPSKRWEAVRDGTEDYSMLMALRVAAEAPGADPALAERARVLLSGQAVTVGDFCNNDDDGTIPGKAGLPAVRALADRRYATVTSARRELRDLLQLFGE